MKYDEWNEWKNTNPWLISTNSGLAGTPVLTRSTNLFDGITDIAIYSLLSDMGFSWVRMVPRPCTHDIRLSRIEE